MRDRQVSMARGRRAMTVVAGAAVTRRRYRRGSCSVWPPGGERLARMRSKTSALAGRDHPMGVRSSSEPTGPCSSPRAR